MTIVIEVDKQWGGFYTVSSKTSKRLVLGYIAFTYHPFNLYERFRNIIKRESQK